MLTYPWYWATEWFVNIHQSSAWVKYYVHLWRKLPGREWRNLGGRAPTGSDRPQWSRLDAHSPIIPNCFLSYNMGSIVALRIISGINGASLYDSGVYQPEDIVSSSWNHASWIILEIRSNYISLFQNLYLRYIGQSNMNHQQNYTGTTYYSYIQIDITSLIL